MPRLVLVTAALAALAATVFLFCRFVLCDFPGLSRFWPPSSFSLGQILEFIKSSGYWGVGLSVGLMVLHNFIPFPAELLAIANGMVYGPVSGTLITWTGAMLGAFLAFGLSRRFGRPLIARLLSAGKMRVLDEWVKRNGAETLLASRFIPVISFNLINYAAGLTPVSRWTFAWTTGLGILPLTVLMVAMGNQIHSLPWFAWVLLMAAGALVGLLLHRFLGRRRAAAGT